MSEHLSNEQRQALVRTIDRADDRWQHGIGSGGYDLDGPMLGITIEALADAIAESDWLAEVRAQARADFADEALLRIESQTYTGETANGATDRALAIVRDLRARPDARDEGGA